MEWLVPADIPLIFTPFNETTFLGFTAGEIEFPSPL